jgi:hypothetical protein
MSAVYRLSAEDFSQLGLDAIVARLDRWRQVWAALETQRVRLVFRTTPMDMGEPIRRARRREAEVGDEITVQHLRQYTGLLDRASRSSVMGIEHYLVLPTMEGTESDTVADMLSSGLGLRALPVPDLPPLLPTQYCVHAGMLAPESGNYPLYSVLVSYDMAGQWDYAVFPKLMSRGPLALAVEIVTHHGAAAYGKLDRVQELLRGLMVQIGSKAALEKMRTGYAALMAGVQQGDALHQVGVAVLVQGRTEAELLERERQVISSVTGRVYLRKIEGMTSDLFRAFFTSAPKPEPPVRLFHNMTSAGVAVASGPLGVRRRTDTQGILWGISGQMPYFWDGFGPDLKEPNHGIILGVTGSGKTVSVFAMALREMNMMSAQVVVMEPMGNCRRLVQAVGPERASYNPLSMRSLRINPIEVLYDDPAEQSAHLAVVISLLLGRALAEEEEIALDAIVPMIYEGVTPETPAVNQPRLENLAWALRSLGGERWLRDAAARLGGLLEERYIRGTRAAVFNVPTQSDWRLESDLVAFDFQGIPEAEGLRRLGYYLVLSAIQREAGGASSSWTSSRR